VIQVRVRAQDHEWLSKVQQRLGVKRVEVKEVGVKGVGVKEVGVKGGRG
jgi:hypothetical protein